MRRPNRTLFLLLTVATVRSRRRVSTTSRRRSVVAPNVWLASRLTARRVCHRHRKLAIHRVHQLALARLPYRVTRRLNDGICYCTGRRRRHRWIVYPTLHRFTLPTRVRIAHTTNRSSRRCATHGLRHSWRGQQQHRYRSLRHQISQNYPDKRSDKPVTSCLSEPTGQNPLTGHTFPPLVRFG